MARHLTLARKGTKIHHIEELPPKRAHEARFSFHACGRPESRHVTHAGAITEPATSRFFVAYRSGAEVDEASMQRFVGAIEARTSMLEKRMDVVERDIKAQLSEIYASIRGVQSSVDASKGGRRALAWCAGVVTGAAALVTVLYQIGALHGH